MARSTTRRDICQGRPRSEAVDDQRAGAQTRFMVRRIAAGLSLIVALNLALVPSVAVAGGRVAVGRPVTSHSFGHIPSSDGRSSGARSSSITSSRITSSGRSSRSSVASSLHWATTLRTIRRRRISIRPTTLRRHPTRRPRTTTRRLVTLRATPHRWATPRHRKAASRSRLCRTSSSTRTDGTCSAATGPRRRTRGSGFRIRRRLRRHLRQADHRPPVIRRPAGPRRSIAGSTSAATST